MFKCKNVLILVISVTLFSQLAFAGRYYDARVGRFLQVDPKAQKYPACSPYTYTLDNPLKYIDADGKDVMFHESARDSKSFNNALNLYLKTQLGFQQMHRFQNDHTILVVYQVGNIEKTAGESVAGGTRWIFGSRLVDQTAIDYTKLDIPAYAVDNKGKSVIVITLDLKTLNKYSNVKNSENIYHEGKAHIEGHLDKGEIDGVPNDENAEHKDYGTDGASPIKPGSPADKYTKQAEKVQKEEDQSK